jgi:hypothetical protein
LLAEEAKSKTGQQRSRTTACKKKLSGGTYVTNEIGLNVGMNASKPLKRMTAREEREGSIVSRRRRVKGVEECDAPIEVRTRQIQAPYGWKGLRKRRRSAVSRPAPRSVRRQV